MALPPVQLWFKVDVTFARLDDATTKVLSFTNRPGIAETTAIYYPLLLQVDGCGMTTGQDGMPVQSTGTITISDPPCSLGHRRIFDLLQEYTCVQQTVQIYATELALDDTSPQADWVSQWKGKIASLGKELADGQQFVLNVESIALPTNTITPLLGEAAPELTFTAGLEGQAFPLSFGADVDIPLVQIETTPSPKWVIQAIRNHSGTSQFDVFPSTEDDTFYYVRDDEGFWRRFWDATYTSHDAGVNYPTPQGSTERAYHLDDFSATRTTSRGAIVTTINWTFRGQNNGAITPTGNLFFTIYQLDDIGAEGRPGRILGTATIDKADYLTEVRGASDFVVTGYFDRPVVISALNASPVRPGYAVSMRQSNYDTSVTDFVDGGYDGSPTNRRVWTRTDNGEWGDVSTVSQTAVIEIVALDDQSSTEQFGEGTAYPYAAHYLRLDHSSSDGAPEVQLEIVARGHRVIDDNDGLITGTPGGDITRPDHVVKYITMTWNGTDWIVSTDWDFSRFDAYYTAVWSAVTKPYARYVAGATREVINLSDFLAAIAKELAFSVVQLTSGKFAICPWGYGAQPSYIFSDEDIEGLSFTELDASSVINRVKIAYNEDLVQNQGLLGAALGNFSGYGGFLDWKDGYSELATAYTNKSDALYGVRELEQINAQFIGDSQSAATLAQYYTSTFDYPHRVITFSVPFWANRAIEQMDIIEVITTRLPAINGTSFEATQPTWEGQETDLLQNDRLVQAQRYRCVVVGRSVSMTRDGAGRLQITARIISPYHPNDPT